MADQPANQPTNHNTGQDDEQPPIPVNIPKDIAQEQIPPIRPKISKRKILTKIGFLILGLLVLAGLAFAAWRFVSKDDTQSQTTGTTTVTETENTGDESEELSDTDLSQTYKSDFLLLEFKHPIAWKVTEGSNFILVKSPNFNLQDKNGAQINAHFKIYIKKGASPVDGSYLGKGYAVAASEKIKYTEPAAGQRPETNLTNFGLETPDNFAYFVVQGNFELMQGDTLGPKFAAEPDSFLIAGGFGSDDQTDGLATKILSSDTFSENSAYKIGVEIIKSLKLK